MPNFLHQPDPMPVSLPRRHQITLTFDLAEPVTPDWLARRVAEACFSYGALRPNEGVLLPSDPEKCFRLQGERVDHD